MNKSETNERPIIFSGPMVRAILDGRKTQTRRIFKRKLTAPDAARFVEMGEHDGNWFARFSTPWPDVVKAMGWGFDPTAGPGKTPWDNEVTAERSPYGGPGSRLWVRETCSIAPYKDDGMSCRSVYYLADGVRHEGIRSTPSIHMPRWASRITLAVESVRVERLQEITEEDAHAEGAEYAHALPDCIGDDQPIIGRPGETKGTHPHKLAFACLWDEINGDRVLWSSNPWVWAVSFRRVTP